MEYTLSRSYAEEQDAKDPLASFREEFHFPVKNGNKTLYFCGNSLGLQPRATAQHLEKELAKWRDFAVDGHFMPKERWYDYHNLMKTSLAKLVGGKQVEVTPMATLTVNLHLLMVSFYRPTSSRYKIICEGGAFPSDQYAMETQVLFHGHDPADTIVEVHPRKGEHTLRTNDILAAIQEHRNELALVLFSGVQYYTGQLFDMEAIARAGHEAGAMVGFDLAHAIGNVPLQLNKWEVDFATWCTYKYLNSGPGSISGIFVHEKYADARHLPRFAGWWGYEEETRFKMEKGFKPMRGADGWQLSNLNILPAASLRASLAIFDRAGIDNLRQKSLKLTGYLEYLLENIRQKEEVFEIITPENPEERGCQLSLLFQERGREVFEALSESGVICDYREPNVIRLAPAPLYNSFTDVFETAELLEQVLVKSGANV